MILLLLKYNANINSLTLESSTALHYAVSNNFAEKPHQHISATK